MEAEHHLGIRPKAPEGNGGPGDRRALLDG
jgi:hypothetical protein